MCFNKKSTGDMAMTAWGDVYCVKLIEKVDGELNSPYRKAKWVLGKKKVAKAFDSKTVGTSKVDIGLHSYRVIQRAVPLVAGGGSRNLRVFLAKIPKGAKYYENDHEYCSNALVLVSEIKVDKKEKVTKKKKYK